MRYDDALLLFGIKAFELQGACAVVQTTAAGAASKDLWTKRLSHKLCPAPLTCCCGCGAFGGASRQLLRLLVLLVWQWLLHRWRQTVRLALPTSRFSRQAHRATSATGSAEAARSAAVCFLSLCLTAPREGLEAVTPTALDLCSSSKTALAGSYSLMAWHLICLIQQHLAGPAERAPSHVQLRQVDLHNRLSFDETSNWGHAWWHRASESVHNRTCCASWCTPW